MEGLPRVVLPDKQKPMYKFIQMYIDEQPFFRAGSFISYHSDILAEILRQAELTFEEMEDPFGDLVPRPKGTHYELVGAGTMIHGETGFLLYDISRSYGLTPNQKHLDDLAPYILDGIKFKIRGE